MMQKLVFTPRVITAKPVTKNQSLATEIYLHFDKRLPFPRILGMIRQKGYSGVREAWQESVKSEAKDKLALFIWKVAQQKFELKEI